MHPRANNVVNRFVEHQKIDFSICCKTIFSLEIRCVNLEHEHMLVLIVSDFFLHLKWLCFYGRSMWSEE
jgi:hypothetical protein